MIMLAYPAYTIRRIEDELTPRKVRELMSSWNGNTPTFLSMSMLRRAVWSFAGIEEDVSGGTYEPQTKEEVMRALFMAGAKEGLE